MSRHLLSPSTNTIKVEVSGSLNERLKAPNDPDFCWPNLGIAVGGSGLTLGLSFISYQLHFAKKRKQAGEPVNMSIRLINCTRDSQDLFGSELLKRSVSEFPDILKIIHVMKVIPECPDNQFIYRRGRISPEILHEFMPTAENAGSGIVVICGPPPFNEAVGEYLTDELKLPETMTRFF